MLQQALQPITANTRVSAALHVCIHCTLFGVHKNSFYSSLKCELNKATV